MTERSPHEKIDHQFNHHPPTVSRVKKHEEVRGLLAGLAHDFVDLLPDSREKSLTMTKLEEAMFWANAAIARNEL